MTIKLKQITVTGGEVTFRFEYDLPAGLQSIDISKAFLDEEFKKLRELLGRDITLQDIRELIKRIINQLREGRKPVPNNFNWAAFIDLELET